LRRVTAIEPALEPSRARIRIQGFLVSDYMAQATDFYREMAALMQAGKMRSEETVFDGFDAMPKAFLGLFSGENTGKMLVKI
jgi:NADPH-dependent curcumin reductase CurA